MRIYHNQLNQTLAKSLAPIWLVFGDEPWQKNDAIFQIKSAAKAQGFDVKIIKHVLKLKQKDKNQN